MSQSSDGPDAAALRAQFDAEVRVADLILSDDDRERLFAMWADHMPTRERLRTAAPALDEEPSFVEKPTLLGGGVTPPGARTERTTATSGGAS